MVVLLVMLSLLPISKRTERVVTLVAFALLLIIYFVTRQAFAQQAVPVQSGPPPQTIQVVKSDTERQKDQLARVQVAQTFLRETLDDLTCQLIGVNRTSSLQKCLVTDTKTGGLRPLSQAEIQKDHYERGGLIAMGSGSIAMMYTKPTNTVAYIDSLVGNFGVTKHAYAQVDCTGQDAATKPECNNGTGFQSLSFIQNIFILFRNITYILMVIIFAIVGLGIMLRFHIDPRTVMTIQNQIPKAIIAILLITFSYAIAGLLVDAMWTVTYFGINVVGSARDKACAVGPNGAQLSLAGSATTSILNHPIQYTTNLFGDQTGCFGSFDGISGLALDVGSSFADLVSHLVLATIGGDEFIPPCGAFGLGNGDFGGCIQQAIFIVVKFLVGILAVLIVLIALIASLFRLWFVLLKNYIMVLVDIMLAPIYILLGLIPGSSYGFGKWFRSVVAQLAVFPMAAIILVLASVVASDPKVNNPTAGVFLPPLIGNPSIANGLGSILAFGFILLTPNLIDIFRDALNAPASKHTGVVTAGIGAAAGRLMSAGRGTTEQIAGRNEAVPRYAAGAQGGMAYERKGFRFMGIRVGR